jgi:hypothetical protein
VANVKDSASSFLSGFDDPIDGIFLNLTNAFDEVGLKALKGVNNNHVILGEYFIADFVNVAHISNLNVGNADSNGIISQLADILFTGDISNFFLRYGRN